MAKKKLEISHASQILTNERQILVLSQLSNYYCTVLIYILCIMRMTKWLGLKMPLSHGSISSSSIFLSVAAKILGIKEIQIILRLFLVITMYFQVSSIQFNESLNLPRCQLAGKEAQVYAVGSNSLETTYILFKLPHITK